MQGCKAEKYDELKHIFQPSNLVEIVDISKNQ